MLDRFAATGCSIAVVVSGWTAPAVELKHLRVSNDAQHLEHSDGSGFLYLAVNAWALAHEQSMPEIEDFAVARAKDGFTVIHLAIGVPGKPLSTPSHRGHVPFKDGDLSQPHSKRGANNDYWDHLETVIETFAKHGIRTGIAPAWGQQGAIHSENSELLGQFLGDRFRDHSAKLVWIMGDGTLHDSTPKRNVWRALAKGIEVGSGGSEKVLMTSIIDEGNSSGEIYHVDDWQDLNGMHRSATSPLAWKLVDTEMGRWRPKPILELVSSADMTGLEPQKGAYELRRRAYWYIFAGAAGYTLTPISGGSEKGDLLPADAAVARQLGYIRSLFRHRPFAGATAAPELLFDSKRRGAVHAPVLKGNGFALIYLPKGKTVEVSLSCLGDRKPVAWWCDPRWGNSRRASPQFSTDSYQRFDPPGDPGGGNDWVLVLDSASFPAP